MTRPATLVVVLGTGTEVGKTWVACRVLDRLRRDGGTVAARKPAQSWDPDERAAGAATDAELLAAATGEAPERVCPAHRSYALALAPPMAATRLGHPAVRLADLVGEVRWDDGTEVGVVEGAGGVRSPIADDGDGADLARALAPDLVLVVADAGLGTINAVRSAGDALRPLPVVVLLNRFDDTDDVHVGNLEWLRTRDGFDVLVSPDALAARLAALRSGRR